MTNTDHPTFVSIETCAYSGATLLTFLLGAHPQIATVGEMDGPIRSEDLDEYRCSCGQKIKTCEFWQSVKVAMHTRGFEFDVAHFGTKFVLDGSKLIQYLRLGSSRNYTLDLIRDKIFAAWPREKRQLEAWVARNTAFVEAVLEITGADVFIDSSKDRSRLKLLYKSSSLDIRAIHLIRDVRGVATSWMRLGRGLDARESAWQWVKLNQKIHITLQSLPKERHTLLRYEDLCQDVHGTLEQLYRFCGVDPAFKVTDFRTVPHHIIGNAMRLRSTSEIKLDERWKRTLTKDQLQEIDRVAGNLSRRYGYC